MSCSKTLLCGALLIFAPALASADPTFTDPAKAGPDFAVQGEYVGAVKTDSGDQKYGSQVVARGDGKFHLVGYRGGLPGDGWDKMDKTEADAKTEDGKVCFNVPNSDTKGVIADGVITIKTPAGDTIGTLKKVQRKSPTLGEKPPAGAVVLFDGTTADKFEGGKMTKDGLLQEGAVSKEKFGSAKIHLEFRTPFMPADEGQHRGNSGCYVQGRYEIQILDSFGLEGKEDECGGLYKVAPPAVNMAFPPLSWQTYDIDFTAAQYEGGKKVKNARITVRQNGVVIQDNAELPQETPGGTMKDVAEPGPLFLQNHGNPVRFRNIWVLPKP